MTTQAPVRRRLVEDGWSSTYDADVGSILSWVRGITAKGYVDRLQVPRFLLKFPMGAMIIVQSCPGCEKG